MDTLADLRDGGMEIDELHAWAEANKLRMHHWFFSTDLTFYVRGGRISKPRVFSAACSHLPAPQHGRSRQADPAFQDPF
jgi:fatty acid-binding protein DegV